MAQLKRKFIENNAVNGSKIRLDNNEVLKGRNAADDADISILKVNASDKVEFSSVPQATSDASAANDLVRKSQFDTGLGTKVNNSEKGAANGVATLGADSKLTASQIPAIAITDTFVVASEAAMLALTCEQGDVAVRTDVSKSYILVSGLPSVLANWQELLTPMSPVQSVNGQTGVVVLSTSDISEGTNKYYVTATARGDIIASSIVDGDTTHAPDGNSVFDALALKANDSIVVKSVNGVSPTAGAVTIDTDDIAEGSTNLYFLDSRAKTAAVVNSTAGSQTDQAASVSSMKSYVSGAISAAARVEKVEVITLSSAAFVELSFPISASDAVSMSAGGLEQEPGSDFTISINGGTGGVGKLTFAGNYATIAEVGDKVVVRYSKAA